MLIGVSLLALSARDDQCFALNDFHHDTSEKQLWVHDCGVGWGQASDCCTWAKVGCDSQGRVIKLDLSGCGIKGGIGSLLSIETLQSLSLANNQLGGPLPNSLSAAPALKSLTLYENQFTGNLVTLGSAHALELFDGHFNNFTGTLPASLSTQSNLSYISVANNNLTGTIPASWAELKELTTIGLAYNQLSRPPEPVRRHDQAFCHLSPE
jgi:hypothetical protein